MTRWALTLILVGALAGCTQDEVQQTKQKATEAEKEIKREVDQAGKAIKKKAEEAEKEIEKEVDQMKKAVKKDTTRTTP